MPHSFGMGMNVDRHSSSIQQLQLPSGLLIDLIFRFGKLIMVYNNSKTAETKRRNGRMRCAGGVFETLKDANLRKLGRHRPASRARPSPHAHQGAMNHCKSVGETTLFLTRPARTTRYGGRSRRPIHILLMFSARRRTPDALAGTVNAGHELTSRRGQTMSSRSGPRSIVHKRERLFGHDNVFFNQRRGILLGPRLDDPADVRREHDDHV